MKKYEDLYLNYINGVWRDGSGDFEIIDKNPFSQEVIGTFKTADANDINMAYEGALEKQETWQTTNPYEVSAIIKKAAKIMEERREEIIDYLVKESGSTIIKASIELDTCIGITELAAEYPFKMETILSPSMVLNKVNHTIRKPVGVVGLMGPFNFPMFLAIRTVSPALAVGNAVVLKPSSDTPVTGGTLIAKIFEEAGLPKGLLSIVVPKTSEIKDIFYEHEIPDLISFTGSTQVGTRIGEIAGKHVKKSLLELGGNNALVVLDDADIDYAIKSAVFGRFLHSGQICMSANRIVVDETIYDEFVEKFVALTKTLHVGNPKDPDTFIGPLINEKEAKRVVEWVEKAKAEGAEVVLEGKREKTLVYPYVIKATNKTYTAKHEVFGPVANIICAKNEADALKIANDTTAGLSGAIYTKNKERAFAFASKWKTGMIHINDQSVNDEPRIAFGGEKYSGIGRFGREIGLDELTTYKWISDQKEKREYPI